MPTGRDLFDLDLSDRATLIAADARMVAERTMALIAQSRRLARPRELVDLYGKPDEPNSN